jgi:hypothetical protein
MGCSQDARLDHVFGKMSDGRESHPTLGLGLTTLGVLTFYHETTTFGRTHLMFGTRTVVGDVDG